MRHSDFWERVGAGLIAPGILALPFVILAIFWAINQAALYLIG